MMPLPTPRKKAVSIADLLARQKGLVQPDAAPIPPISQPFGGLPLAQLQHEAWLSVQGKRFNGSTALAIRPREEIAEYEPIESVEGEVVEPERLERVEPAPGVNESTVTHVHVHLH